MKSFQSQPDEAQTLMCRMPGCRNVWTVDILHGRVCSHHDAVLSRGSSSAPPTDRAVRHQAPIPLRDAVRPFAEPEEHDEEYVHDDAVSQ